MKVDEAEVEIGRLLECHANAGELDGLLVLRSVRDWTCVCPPLDRDDIHRLVLALSVIAAELHRLEVSDDR